MYSCSVFVLLPDARPLTPMSLQPLVPLDVLDPPTYVSAAALAKTLFDHIPPRSLKYAATILSSDDCVISGCFVTCWTSVWSSCLTARPMGFPPLILGLCWALLSFARVQVPLSDLLPLTVVFHQLRKA
jgi:hypothetical protein